MSQTVGLLLWVLLSAIWIGGAAWVHRRLNKNSNTEVDIDRETYEDHKKPWSK